MTSVVNSSGKKFIVYTKGASEIVLEHCTSVLDDEGNVNFMNNDLRNKLKERIESMADTGMI
jgi:magnesium-transporting ATPase (P-type)